MVQIVLLIQKLLILIKIILEIIHFVLANFMIIVIKIQNLFIFIILVEWIYAQNLIMWIIIMKIKEIKLLFMIINVLSHILIKYKVYLFNVLMIVFKYNNIITLIKIYVNKIVKVSIQFQYKEANVITHVNI